MRRWPWLVGGVVALLVVVAATFPLWRPLVVDDRVSETVAGGGSLRALAVGSFVNGQQPYQTSGRAIVGETADGSRIVRLEGFRTTNGPDLYVYLSTNATPATSDQVGRFVDLGRLRGNVGDQNYTIARDVDLAQFRSVVIYCRAFTRVFGYATITAP